MHMKEILSEPPAIVRNDAAAIQQLFRHYVMPTYSRFDLVLSHGAGSYVFDVTGKRYLDLGGGIAVCALGHANPEITEALISQSQKLVHVSNLYYHEPQGRLAQALVNQIAPGKVFLCNSGGEANEGLFKVARKFGHDEGRYEILTTINSFHGRTLAGISATGQEKVKKGFEPMVDGFRHVPYNDLEAMRQAISPGTIAILIEGIQGEGGVAPARAEYLLGLRQLCDEKKLLLMMDEVQCGHFRSGQFQSYQRLLEGVSGADKFLPDAVSMAKSLGGGFPIGAFWVRAQLGDVLGPGTHATTFGGTPLACTVALKVLEVIERDQLARNARETGEFLLAELRRLASKYPNIITDARGLGLMLGFTLAGDIHGLDREKGVSIQFVNRLHGAGLLAIPAGAQVVRLLPPLNLRRNEAEEGIRILESVVQRLAA
jgi:acetylornithine/N-succinyldiaminopimelate aminotransferase